MKTLSTLVCIICLLSVSYAEDAVEKVFVHITGQVKKPGTYEIPAKVTIEELKQISGGDDPFSGWKRIHLIRFPRIEGLYNVHPLSFDKDEILRENQIPKEGIRYLFKRGDIIYVPAVAIGAS